MLRVAEEQAGVLLRNATDQGDRLLVATREEVANRRKEAQAAAEPNEPAGDAGQAAAELETVES